MSGGLGGYVVDSIKAAIVSGGAPKGGQEGTSKVGSYQALWPLTYEQGKGDWFLGRVVPRDSLASIGHQKMIAHKASEKQHLWMMAPTRRGKGVFEIITNLLMHPQTTLLIDPKGAGYDVAAEALKAKGYKVVLLDPMRRCAKRRGVKNTGDECGFNPLREIDEWSPEAPRKIVELAECLIDMPQSGGGGAEYWAEQARLVAAGILAYSKIFMTPEMSDLIKRKQNEARQRLGKNDIKGSDVLFTKEEREMLHQYDNIVKFCGNFASAGVENREKLLKAMLRYESDQKAAGLPVPPIARLITLGASQATLMLGKGSYAEGIVTMISMFAKAFKWIDSDLIINDLIAMDFKFKMAEMRQREKVVVFVVLPESSLNSHGPWLRMIITSMLNTYSDDDWAPGVNEPDEEGIRVPSNLILDEAPQYGNIPILERAFSMSAGQDLRVVLVSQNKPQIDKLYGKEGASTVVCNSSLLVLGVNDVETGEYIGKKLGKTYSRDEDSNEKGDDKVALLGIDELAKRTHRSRKTAYYLEGGRDPVEVRLCAYHSEEDTGLVAGVDYTQDREWRSAKDFIPKAGAPENVAAKPKGYKQIPPDKRGRIMKPVGRGAKPALEAPHEPKRLGNG